MAGRDPSSIVGDGTALFHDLLEQSASTVETDLDGEQAHPQEAGNLAGGETVGFVQQDDSAIVIWQVVEAALHARARFLALDHLERRGRRGHRRSQLASAILRFRVRMALALAQTIERRVRDDAVEPTPNGVGIAQRIAATMSAEEALLGQVLGLRGISYEAKEIAVDPIVVSLKELGHVQGFDRWRHCAIFSFHCGEIHDSNHCSL